MEEIDLKSDCMCLPAVLISLSSHSFIYSPTVALVSCLKNSIKIYVKI